MSKPALLYAKIMLLIAAQLLFIPAAAEGAPVQALNEQFSGKLAYGHSEFLTRQIGPRPPGSKEELKAGEYIAEKFRGYGWQVSYQDFSRVIFVDKGSLKKYSLVNSRNIIAVRQGKRQDAIVIGAHYDSADFNVPGAADNASGVGVLLELARVLGQQALDSTYILVGFGAEEAGLVGSRYFTDNYDLSHIKLMVNLDMVGEGKIVALDGGGKNSAPPWLMRAAYAAVKEQGLKPEMRRDFMLLARNSRDGGTSDFSPFLDKWIPAIGLGQGGKPARYYHQPTDTMEHVDENTLAACGRIVSSIISRASGKSSQVWNADYLTVDLGMVLLVFGPLSIKIFVLGSAILAAAVLAVKRNRAWISLAWLVPWFFGIMSLAVFAGYLPAYLAGRIKGVEEPWYAFPGIYAISHVLASGLLLYWISRYASFLSRKFLPRNSEVYWAGSIILLGLGTAVMALNRWDFSTYPAFWLLLTILSRIRPVLPVSVLAPLPVYWFHWQLFNSHLGVEFFRTFNTHPVTFSVIYGFGLTPLLFSVAALETGKSNPFPKASLKAVFLALILLTTGITLVPSYTKNSPQPVTVREEWIEHQLMITATSTDRIPSVLIKALGASSGGKEIKAALTGGNEPVLVSVASSEAKMGKERLITVDIKLDYLQSPHLLKLKLSSKQPFALVNCGEFYPVGKLGNRIKLSGEPVGGIYGLVLERTPPQPDQFQMYLKAEGEVRLSLEAQYPGQFIPKRFSVEKAIIKYENLSTVVKEL